MSSDVRDVVGTFVGWAAISWLAYQIWPGQYIVHLLSGLALFGLVFYMLPKWLDERRTSKVLERLPVREMIDEARAEACEEPSSDRCRAGHDSLQFGCPDCIRRSRRDDAED